MTDMVITDKPKPIDTTIETVGAQQEPPPHTDDLTIWERIEALVLLVEQLLHLHRSSTAEQIAGHVQAIKVSAQQEGLDDGVIQSRR